MLAFAEVIVCCVIVSERLDSCFVMGNQRRKKCVERWISEVRIWAACFAVASSKGRDDFRSSSYSRHKFDTYLPDRERAASFFFCFACIACSLQYSSVASLQLKR